VKRKLKIEIRKKLGTLEITLLSLAVLSLIVATPASFASTSRVIQVSGNFTTTLTVVSVNVGPQKTTIFATVTDVLTGTLKVTFVGVIVLYVYPVLRVLSK
jgi:hypothetical protein